jgi:hypothetical protein
MSGAGVFSEERPSNASNWVRQIHRWPGGHLLTERDQIRASVVELGGDQLGRVEAGPPTASPR